MTWYVNASTGSNLNSGTSPNAAFLTITKAISVAIFNDTILVAPGTYNTALGESFALRPASGVQLKSTNGALVTIIDAGGSNPVKRVFELLGNSSSSLIEGFTITGGMSAPNGVNEFSTAAGGGIYCNVNDATVISRNIIRYNMAIGYPGSNASRAGGLATGGALYATNNTVVNNAFIQNYAYGGIGYSPSLPEAGNGGNGGAAEGGAAYGGIMFMNNTFYGNVAQGGAGGSVGQGSGGTFGIPGAGQGGALYISNTAINNIFHSNQALGGSGTCCGAQSAVGTLDYNLFFASVPSVDPATGSHAIVGTDPKIPGALSPQPRASSPVKGAGTASGAPTLDFAGTPRPNPPSLGAYEPLLSKARTDFTGDGRTDLLWHNTSTGSNYVYRMDGTTIVSQDFVNVVSDTGWQIAGTGDFNGDGNMDILWRHSVTGENYIYLMSGSTIGPNGPIHPISDLNWRVAGVGDFDGDGKADILWRNMSTGANYVYFMNGMTITTEAYVNTVADQAWQVAGIGDFNGDGKADLLWRNSASGQDYIYLMNGATIGGNGVINTIPDQNWQVAGIGDFNGDGFADIVWHHAVGGQTYIYYMNGLGILSQNFVNTVPDTNWKIVAIGDLDDNGAADIIWRNSSTGQNYVYMMSGSTIGANGVINVVTDPNWHIYQ